MQPNTFIAALAATIAFCGYQLMTTRSAAGEKKTPIIFVQFSPPLGGQPAPDIPHPNNAGSMPQCTADYKTELAEELEELRDFSAKTVEQVVKFCAAIDVIENGAKAAGSLLGLDEEELEDKLDDLIGDARRELGIPKLTFRFAKHTCVQGAGDMDRHIRTEIGRVQSEISRCKGV